MTDFESFEQEIVIDDMNASIPCIENFYQLGVIGRGSYGTVYRARDNLNHRDVAIKIVDISDIDEQKFSEKFISHSCPQIVRIYQHFVKDNKIYIVMEYLESGSLLGIMKRKIQFDEVSISYIMRELLKALVFLHHKGILHRDIKADNILVGRNKEIKLADFGIFAEVTRSLTKRNTVIGSHYWMAPEIFLEESYDTKVDIWSTGITAIELANGKPPFSDRLNHAVTEMIVQGDPPRLDDTYSFEFRDFVACCLQKDPKYRLSAQDLVEHAFIQKSYGFSNLDIRSIPKSPHTRQLSSGARLTDGIVSHSNRIETKHDMSESHDRNSPANFKPESYVNKQIIPEIFSRIVDEKLSMGMYPYSNLDELESHGLQRVLSNDSSIASVNVDWDFSNNLSASYEINDMNMKTRRTQSWDHDTQAIVALEGCNNSPEDSFDRSINNFVSPHKKQISFSQHLGDIASVISEDVDISSDDDSEDDTINSISSSNFTSPSLHKNEILYPLSSSTSDSGLADIVSSVRTKSRNIKNGYAKYGTYNLHSKQIETVSNVLSRFHNETHHYKNKDGNIKDTNLSLNNSKVNKLLDDAKQKTKDSNMFVEYNISSKKVSKLFEKVIKPSFKHSWDAFQDIRLIPEKSYLQQITSRSRVYSSGQSNQGSIQAHNNATSLSTTPSSSASKRFLGIDLPFVNLLSSTAQKGTSSSTKTSNDIFEQQEKSENFTDSQLVDLYHQEAEDLMSLLLSTLTALDLHSDGKVTKEFLSQLTAYMVEEIDRNFDILE